MRYSRAGLMPLAAALAAVAACAGGPPPGGPGGPGGQGAPARIEPLFISPFGEPFMGEPGGAWPVNEWFAGADANADGAITFAEFEADGRRWFIHLDANEDGRIGYSELAAYEEGLNGLRGFQGGPGGGEGFSGGRGGPPPRRNLDGASQDRGGGMPAGGSRMGRGGGPGGGGGYGRIAEAGYFNLPQPVKGADTNIDQQVTGEEWTAAISRWFLALDTDRDGRLTLDTLPKTPLQVRAESRGPIQLFGNGRRR